MDRFVAADTLPCFADVQFPLLYKLTTADKIEQLIHMLHIIVTCTSRIVEMNQQAK